MKVQKYDGKLLKNMSQEAQCYVDSSFHLNPKIIKRANVNLATHSSPHKPRGLSKKQIIDLAMDRTEIMKQFIKQTVSLIYKQVLAQIMISPA